MKAAQIIEPGTIDVVQTPDPVAGPGEVLIRVHASGICGTDVHIYRGEYLGAYPVIPGHEAAGTVEAVGEGVTRVHVGSRVAFEPNISCDHCVNCLNNRQNFCLNWQGIGVTRAGSMAELVVAPQKNVFGIGALDFEVGCFVEPLSCVLHGIQKANIRLADRILILGAGPIGLLLLQAAALLGAAEIDVLERLPARRSIAASLGARTVFDDFPAIAADAYDVVIDATGSISVLERSIEFVRYGGTLLFFGVAPAGERMRIEPFLIFKKGLTIVSSYTSLRNSYQAVDLLETGRIRVNDLVSHRLPLEDLEQGIKILEGGDETVKKVVITP